MINPNTQAILLLTAHFSKATGEAKPLSPSEWGRFALWLNEQGNTPAQLLALDSLALLRGWSDTKIPVSRIEQLLGRGHALALAMEKWSRAGIWVLTRSDQDYPWRLKKYLRTDAPPVLFGCGNAKLLNLASIAIIGSRNAVDADLDFTRKAGQTFAEAGISVVSGGARGVDEAAMLGCLEIEGTACGVMADSLLKAVTSSKWRSGLMSNNLVLISPFHPEAGFNAGNAMARNKYIYCLSQAALVVHSGIKGGTWNGAIENLKHGWIPLWVKRTSDLNAGNAELVNRGGHWCSDKLDELATVALSAPVATSSVPSDDLLSVKSTFKEDVRRDIAGLEQPSKQNHALASKRPASVIADSGGLRGLDSEEVPLLKEEPFELSFYRFFLQKLEKMDEPHTTESLAERFELPKSLVVQWLAQAADEGVVKKLTKPVRYQSLRVKQQLGLGID
jgi:predicted Rossmann fold nucleotide-binding protein DprA/Smf involved in DNA uptake